MPKWLNPRWDFELTFDGLDSGSAYPGLGAKSLQALMGFFIQTSGAAYPFLYYDPTDYQAAIQYIGTGNGTNRAFQLQRNIGGLVGALEWIIAPFTATTPTLFQLAGSPLGYAPNNLINYSTDLMNAAWIKTNTTVTSGVADPFGGTAAFTLTSTAASSTFYQGEAALGANYVNSIWVRRRTGSGLLYFRTPANTNVVFTPTSTWTRFSISGPPAGGLAYLVLQGTVSGDAIDVYGPQTEQQIGTTPSDYQPTLASMVYGGPKITVGGVMVDPSTYSITNGVVTFGAAPANALDVAWSGMFGFLCRFDADDMDFEQIMSGLWQAQGVKFRSVRAI